MHVERWTRMLTSDKIHGVINEWEIFKRDVRILPLVKYTCHFQGRTCPHPPGINKLHSGWIMHWHPLCSMCSTNIVCCVVNKNFSFTEKETLFKMQFTAPVHILLCTYTFVLTYSDILYPFSSYGDLICETMYLSGHNVPRFSYKLLWNTVLLRNCEGDCYAANSGSYKLHFEK